MQGALQTQKPVLRLWQVKAKDVRRLWLRAVCKLEGASLALDLYTGREPVFGARVTYQRTCSGTGSQNDNSQLEFSTPLRK